MNKIFKTITFAILFIFFTVFSQIFDFSLLKFMYKKVLIPVFLILKTRLFFKYGIYLALGFGFFVVACLTYFVYSSGLPVLHVDLSVNCVTAQMPIIIFTV